MDPAVGPIHLVIITDLDGTLLNRDTYSYDKARPALDAARDRGVPVVFCSSKTRVEQIVYRDELGIHDPFIVEDGGAIVIEDGYFEFDFPFQKTIDNYRVIELGTPYETIRQTIDAVQSETRIQLKGYGDMTAAEVAELTGLDRAGAERAMMREYQETLVSIHGPADLERITHAFAAHGLWLSKGGRFLAVSGRHDKGVAVDALVALFRRKLGGMRTIGIGDSHNDLSMLTAVDVPALVMKKPDEWEAIGIPNLIRVDGMGPEGWNRFVLDYLNDVG